MPLPYSQVKDLYDTLADAGVVQKPLSAWSTDMNAQMGSDAFSEGEKDNWIKRASYNIDKGLDWTGLPQAAGNLGALIGKPFGMEEQGREMGRGIPRMTVDIGSLFVPGLGEATALPRLAGAAVMGAGHTYAETDSPGAAVVSGGLNALLPGATGAIEQNVLKRLGAPLVKGEAMTAQGIANRALGKALGAGDTYGVDQYMGTAGQNAASWLGGQAGALGMMAGGGMAEQALDPNQTVSNPFTKEFALSNLIQQLPFMAMHGAHKVFGPSAEKARAMTLDNIAETARIRGENAAAERMAAQNTPPPIVPVSEDPNVQEQTNKLLQKFGVVPADVKSQVDDLVTRADELRSGLTADMSAAERVMELEKIDDQLKEHNPATATWNPNVETVPLTGTIHHVDTTSNYMIVRADENPELGYKAGDLVAFPTTLTAEKGKAYTFGQQGTFDAPKDKGFRKVVVDKDPQRTAKKILEFYAKKDAKAAQPDLPQQEGDALTKWREDVARQAAEQKVHRDEALARIPDVQGKIERAESPSEVASLLREIDDIRKIGSIAGNLNGRVFLIESAKDGITNALQKQLNAAHRILKAKEKAQEQRQAGIDVIEQLQKTHDPRYTVVLNMMEKGLDDPATAITHAQLPQAVARWIAKGQHTPEALQSKLDYLNAKDRPKERQRGGKSLQEEDQHGVALEEKIGKADDVVQSLTDDAAYHVENTDPALQKDKNAFDEIFWPYRRFLDREGEPFGEKEADAFKQLLEMKGLTVEGDPADYATRPHVQEWMNEALKQEVGGPAVAKALRMKAGNPFVWSYNPDVRIPKGTNGVVDEAYFVKNAGHGEDLPKVELETMKALVPEAFENGKVHVGLLNARLPDREPVTTVTYGMEGKVSEVKAELNKMTHEFGDTLSFKDWEDISAADRQDVSNEDSLSVALIKDFGWEKADADKAEQFITLKRKVAAEPSNTSPRATSYYKSISPVDNNLKWTFNGQEFNSQPLRIDILFKGGKGPSDTLHTPLGPETGGWAMVQMVPGRLVKSWKGHPDEPVMLVGEQQSLWGQEVTRQRSEAKKTEASANARVEADIKDYLDKVKTLRVVKTPTREDLTAVIALDANGKRVPVNDFATNKPLNALGKSLAEGDHSFSSELRTQVKTEAVKIAREFTKKIVYGNLKETSANPHPLLLLQHVLVLKATIAEAQKRGVTKMVVSDGETAMMTEKHDKAAVRTGYDDYSTRPDGDGYIVLNENDNIVHRATTQEAADDWLYDQPQRISEPSQSGGMRLHYDTTLQSAMRSLTGDKGEKVELGVHKNAREQKPFSAVENQPWVLENTQTGEVRYHGTEQGANRHRESMTTPSNWEVNPNEQLANVGKVVGSPVFRNPDGTPKSSVTGTSYDLKGAFTKMDSNEGFTLGRTASALKRNTAKLPLNQFEKRNFDKYDLGGNTHDSLTALVQNGSRPEMQALAQDLLDRHGEALKRVAIRVSDEDTTAHTSRTRFGYTNIERVTLGGSPFILEKNILEEAVHHLTMNAMLDEKNAPIVERLQKIRQQLIKQLPADEKKALQSALNAGWMKKYIDGNATVNELYPDDFAKAAKIYGLMNVEEFVAHGLLPTAVRRMMLQTEAKKGGWFNKFVGYIKNLLGVSGPNNVGKDTLWNEFLHHTSALMESNSAAVDFHQYAERMLLNAGVQPENVHVQVTRAVELLHALDVFSPIDHQDILFTVEASVDDHMSERLRKATVQLQQAISDPAHEDYDAIRQLTKDAGVSMTTRGIDGMLSDAFAGDLDLKEILEDVSTPPLLAKYLLERARNMHEVIAPIAGAIDARNEGLMNLTDASVLRKPFGQADTEVRAILGSHAIRENNNKTAVQLSHMTADVVPDKIATALRGEIQEPERKGLWEKVGDVISRMGGKALSNWIATGAQLARSSSLWAEWMSHAGMMDAEIHNAMKESWKAFGQTPEETAKATAVLNDKQTATAVRKWMGINQTEGKKNKAVTLLSPSHPLVEKVLAGLKPEQRIAVAEFMGKSVLAKKQMDAHALLKASDHLALTGAGVLMRMDPRFTTQKAYEFVKQLNDVAAQAKSNPAIGLALKAQFDGFAAQTTPEAYSELLKQADMATDKLALMKSVMDANPAWITASRKGKYLFDYMEGGERKIVGADSETQALHESGGRPLIPGSKRDNARPDSSFIGPGTEAMLARANELDDNYRRMLERSGASEEEKARFEQMRTGLQLEKEAAYGIDADPRQGAAGRGLSKIGENFPWERQQKDWFANTASYWSKRVFRRKVDTLLTDPMYKTNPVERQRLKDFTDTFLTPDPQAGRTMQKMTALFSLSWNPASAISFIPQNFQRGMPELIRMGHGVMSAKRELTKAMSEYLSHKVSGKDPWTEEEKRFRAQAIHDGQVDVTAQDEGAMKQDTAMQNFIRAFDGDRPITTGQRLGRTADAFGSAGMFMFHHVDKFNNNSMLMAAFRTLKKFKPEASFDEIKKEAYLVNAAVNDIGGKANRPIGMFNNLQGPAGRFAAMAMGTLKTYSFGVANQLIRYLKEGYFRPKGLTPAEVHNARKALVTMLGVQFGVAGALGLPFAAGALALLNQAFPNLQLSQKLREHVADFFGSDTESGHLMTNAMMTGLPSMLGWDWSARLGSGQIVPGVDESEGFSLTNMMGAPAAMVGNFFRGTQELAEGQSRGAFNFVPSGFRKLAKLAAGDGKVMDYKNRPILDPTPGEKVGIALGFNPTRLAEFNDAQQMAQQAEDVKKRQESLFHQQQAEEVLKGNFGTVKQTLQQRKLTDPSFQLPAAVSGIAQAAEQQTFPRDLRDEGSKVRGPLLKLWSLPASDPDEVQKTMFRTNIERSLGLVKDSSGEIQNAAQMDALRKQHPTATGAELRLILARQRGLGKIVNLQE